MIRYHKRLIVVFPLSPSFFGPSEATENDPDMPAKLIGRPPCSSPSFLSLPNLIGFQRTYSNRISLFVFELGFFESDFLFVLVMFL